MRLLIGHELVKALAEFGLNIDPYHDFEFDTVKDNVMESPFDHQTQQDIGDRQVIALMCVGGFTSSLLARAMQNYFDQHQLPYYVMYSAVTLLSTPSFLEDFGRKVSLVMLSPQVHYHFDEAKQALSFYDIPVRKIDKQDYCQIDYQRVSEVALDNLRLISV
ncbi:hypothetical protein [Vibrio sp. LaRot3]|uniref:hypothetical protein n=1 Tax=Vibrio sp. LaRot3 TaxID=2998829 RepID=UPI0022CDE098|nr:hypothetical protein [Vibrio sp. LaRot3]MDA0147400.1 hypothetical protein [Vibrio sp. LaRot3]